MLLWGPETERIMCDSKSFLNRPYTEKPISATFSGRLFYEDSGSDFSIHLNSLLETISERAADGFVCLQS